MTASHTTNYRPWVVLLAPSMALAAWGWAQWSMVPENVWLLLPLLIAVVSGLMLRYQRVIGWVLLGVALGMSAMQLKMIDWQQHQLPLVWQHTPMQATLNISGVAKAVSGGWQVSAEVEDAPVADLIDQTIQLYWVAERRPLAGEVWSVRMSLQQPSTWHNPGGMDMVQWLFTKHVVATGKATPLATEPSAQYDHWQNWRTAILLHLSQLLPADRPFSGLSIALIMGEASGVSQEQWQVLRDTGTLHLAVVSGMHITLVAGFVWWFAVLLWRIRPNQAWPAAVVGAWAALAAALLFSLLAGMTLPVQRALIMFCVVVLAVLIKRKLHPALTLSWALLLVLAWDVAAVLQPGFWLSFIATGALLWIVSSSGHWLWKIFATHVGMTLLMTPLLVLFFQQMSVYAPVANFIAAPVIELLLVPLLLLTTMLSWLLPALALQIAQLTDLIWSLLWPALEAIALWPKAVLSVSLSSSAMLLMLLWLAGLWWLRSRLVSVMGVAWLVWPSLVLPVLPAASAPLMQGSTRLVVFDTGNTAMSALLQTSQGVWLLGVGQAFGQQHTMNSVILPSLTALGVDRLAGVVYWAEDADNQQGLAQLQQRLAVERVVSNADCSAILPTTKSQLVGKTCWLQVNRQPDVWMTWQAPTDLPAWSSDALVMSPKPATNKLKHIQTDYWLTAQVTASEGLTRHAITTQCQGAVTFEWSSSLSRVQVVRRAREAHQRFYHGACE
jgi:competence protein ComEC